MLLFGLVHPYVTNIIYASVQKATFGICFAYNDMYICSITKRVIRFAKHFVHHEFTFAYVSL